MKVTNVRVRLKDKEDDKVKAIASIVFDDCFVVNGVKVVEGTNGMFVAMPSERNKFKEGYRDIVHPINKECRKMVHEAIMKEYDAEVARVSTTEEESTEEDNV